MIFVTVGHHVPFKRLIDEMDAIAPQLNDSVIIQQGTYEIQLKNCGGFAFCESLQEYFLKAELVITQGGFVVIELIKMKKDFIVFPRLPKHGEVIDGHQLEFSRHMQKKLGLNFPIVTESKGLLEAILNYRKLEYGSLPQSRSQLKEYLKDYVAGLRERL